MLVSSLDTAICKPQLKLCNFHMYYILFPTFNVAAFTIQSVPGVRVTTSGFNSRANSESNTSYTHVGPIRNGSGFMSF
jgi:hypothetical protein